MHEHARASVAVIGSDVATVESVLNYLVHRAAGDPERLRDAAELLDEDQTEARALLSRPRAGQPT